MILIFHGLLKKMYGDRAEIATNVPADAIEGFFSQQRNHPRDMIVAVADFDTEEKLREVTDVREIHILPAMFGGGGGFAKIILGTILVVAGVLLLTATAATGIGIAFGVALVMTGAGMIAGGVLQLFMKAPTADKTNDPPPSKYLGQNKNTVEQGTAITIACGQINLAGHWLSLQSDADKLMHGTFPVNPT
jgi:predicted phage tail protein